jgi:hypothetical protein
MSRLLKIACLALTSTLGAIGCAANTAETKGTDRPTYSLSMKFGEMMKKVAEDAKDKHWDEALADLDRVAAHKHLNPYERAAIFAARAGVHMAVNKTDEGVKDLEQAVALDAMPEEQQLDATYNLAQLYFTLDRFSEAADTFGKWAQRAKNPPPEKYYLTASAYAQAHRFAEALPFAKKAVEGMKEPKEPWLQLLVSLHYELHQEAELAAVLQRLTQLFPKKEYSLQLAATYQETNQNDKAVSALETAYEKGLLTEEKDLVNLARLYLRQPAPLKGAALLDKQMQAGKVSKTPQNLELLATCWVMGEDAEHAEAALKQAGDAVGSGQVYIELARIDVEHGAWIKARDALSSALQKGGLASPGEAHLLLGVVHYNTKRKDAALSSLAEAKRHPETAKCADEWIQLVKSGRPGTAGGCAVVKTVPSSKKRTATARD